jgi:psp operon transcriptional activator
VVNFIMAGYKDNLLGEANSFLEVLEQVSRLAPLNKPVLIIGERGTGKELSPTVFTICPDAGMALHFP